MLLSKAPDLHLFFFLHQSVEAIEEHLTALGETRDHPNSREPPFSRVQLMNQEMGMRDNSRDTIAIFALSVDHVNTSHDERSSTETVFAMISRGSRRGINGTELSVFPPGWALHRSCSLTGIFRKLFILAPLTRFPLKSQFTSAVLLLSPHS